MIEDKFVDLYARNSGLRDKLVAERDVVLTYALRALLDAGVMDHLAFKGGTCLRKIVFGSAGRFSEDLDFTLDSDGPEDDVLEQDRRDLQPRAPRHHLLVRRLLQDRGRHLASAATSATATRGTTPAASTCR